MYTETTQTRETFATQPDPLKLQILDALHRFVRQRPGLDWRNYGGRAAYREEMRGITRDLRHAEALLSQVALAHTITGEDLITASRLSFSGRLKINQTPDGVTIDYTTGQYFPTEYRCAVAAICAGALWDWVRDKAMPTPVYGVEWKNERGEWIPTGKDYDSRIMAEMVAAEVRSIRNIERVAAFETPPARYGETMIVERYRFAGVPHALSAGDWLRRYFRREFGRGIASRFFN